MRFVRYTTYVRLIRALVFGFAGIATLSAQYAGPAILSRGEAPATMITGPISFQPFVSATAVYDTGMGGIAVTDTGQLASRPSFGQTLAAGVSGTHRWRHSVLGVDYRGSVTHYNRVSTLNVNQAILLGFTHQFSRRVVLSLRESAGVFSREYGVARLVPTVPFDPGESYIPTTDFFENRTYYATTQADLTYQKTMRLSFTAGADGFFTRRRSKALSGTVGAAARGDVQYRVSRRATAGAGYMFNHYEFSRVSGGSDMHGVIGTYANRLTSTVEVSGYAGAMRIESKFVRTLPVDPLIAALLGITSSRQIVHQINWRPLVAGRISKLFRTGLVYASGGHSVTPGNGLFLTSYTTRVTGGYTFTGFRRWAVSAQAGYQSSTAIGLLAGTYGTATLRGSVARQLRYGLHLVSAVGVRRYDSRTYENYNRLIYQASLGLAFTPRDISLRLW